MRYLHKGNKSLRNYRTIDKLNFFSFLQQKTDLFVKTFIILKVFVVTDM